MASPLRQPRRAIGNVGRGSKVAPTPVKRSPVQHSGMGGPGSFKKATKANLTQQPPKLTQDIYEKILKEAAKRNATKPRGIPTGPRGLPRGVAPPKQAPRSQPLQQPRNLSTIPGFGYGRSARGALGSRGRPNAKRANPSMRGGYPATATPYTGMVNIGGRQYSKGGLLKSSSKLNTGIKSGK